MASAPSLRERRNEAIPRTATAAKELKGSRVLDVMLYCYIMTDHHHHHDGSTHPAATIRPSLLRFSAAERVAIAVVLAALLWATAFWAMH